MASKPGKKAWKKKKKKWCLGGQQPKNKSGLRGILKKKKSTRGQARFSTPGNSSDMEREGPKCTENAQNTPDGKRVKGKEAQLLGSGWAWARLSWGGGNVKGT